MTALSDLLDTPITPQPGTLGAFILGTDVLAPPSGGSIAVGADLWRMYVRIMKPVSDAVLGNFILGTDTLSSLGWAEITDDAHGVEFTRGGGPAVNPGAGKMVFDLDNEDDSYSVWQSIYWGPGTLVQCGFYLGTSGETLPMWTGIVTSWNERSAGVGARRWVEVEALETITLLGENNENEVFPEGASEAIAARATRVLDAANWQYGHTVTVDSPHQFWGLQETNLADDSWTELQLVAQSLAVVFKPTKAGRVAFTERDIGTITGFETAGIDFDVVADATVTTNNDDTIVGSVPVSRAGGVAATYTSDYVTARYQRRSLPFYNLRTENPGGDADLTRYATDLLDRGDQTYRVLSFSAHTGTDDSIFEFVGRVDLGTRLNVDCPNRDGTGIRFYDYLVCGYTVAMSPLAHSMVAEITVQTEPSADSTWAHYVGALIPGGEEEDDEGDGLVDDADFELMDDTGYTLSLT